MNVYSLNTEISQSNYFIAKLNAQIFPTGENYLQNIANYTSVDGSLSGDLNLGTGEFTATISGTYILSVYGRYQSGGIGYSTTKAIMLSSNLNGVISGSYPVNISATSIIAPSCCVIIDLVAGEKISGLSFQNTGVPLQLSSIEFVAIRL